MSALEPGKTHPFFTPPTSGYHPHGHRLGPETWGLGPSAAVLAPGQTSQGDKIQRKYKRLKITVGMYNWGQIMNKMQKDQNPTSKVQEQKQDTVRDPQIPRRWADHPSHPSSLTHPSAPSSPRSKDQLNPTPIPGLREQAGTCVSCFCSLKLQHESQ